MRIKSLSINNYRGITGGLEKNRLDFTNTNVIFIFGQNNVGKSTVLKAYNAFLTNDITELDFNHAADCTDPIEFELELLIDENEDRPYFDKVAPNKFDNLKTKYVNSEGLLRIRKTFDRSDKKFKPHNETFNMQTQEYEDTANGGVGLDAPFEKLMPQPLLLKAMPTEDEVQTVVNAVLKNIATARLNSEEKLQLENAQKTISSLQESLYRKEDIDRYRKEVNEKFSRLFKGFSVDIDDGTSRLKFTADKVGRDFKVSFRDSNGIDNTYEQVGHGTIRTAIFLLMLLRDNLVGADNGKKRFIVLFEEPELFLHPILTKELRSLIYSVSNDNSPFQVLCASHSPQMIDITQEKASLVRMTKENDGTTNLFQIKYSDLQTAEDSSPAKVKEKLYEILRIDPFVCESFYADEVLLVEGETEAIIARGYQQEFSSVKDIFVVNCHSVTNIPFYQRFFSKFHIPYSVICDTDHLEKKRKTGWNEDYKSPTFTGSIQKTIQDQFNLDQKNGIAKLFCVFYDTFETAHKITSLPEKLRFTETPSIGKPMNANQYWQQIKEYKEDPEFENIPIVNYLTDIMRN